MKYLVTTAALYFAYLCGRAAVEKSFPLFWGLAAAFTIIGVVTLFIKKK